MFNFNKKSSDAAVSHTVDDSAMDEKREDIGTDEKREHGSHDFGSRDIALELVDTAVAVDFTKEEERSTLRRIDFVLVPLMFLTFALQYLDKACLTGAALFGILTDLDLLQIGVPTSFDSPATIDLKRYSYASLIFYWGFLVGLFPGVYLCQRFPIGKYVAVTMFLWGGVTICAAAVQSYKGLYAQRFFLGIAEASVSPGFSLITVMWYRRAETPLRLAFWYSASGIGALIGSLLLYAIGHVHGKLSPWRYQFIVIGCITSVWAILLFFVLPSNPVQAKFLTQRQRVIAIERVRADQIGIENKTMKRDQVIETFTDPKTYMYMVMIFAVNLTNGAVSGFGSIIVQSFGYPPLKTTLLLGGAGATLFIFLLGSGVLASFCRNSRSLIGMLSCLPVIAGSAMIWKSNWEHKAHPLWGFYLLAIFSTTLVMILSLVAANTAGHTKKAITSGLVWASYCASNGVAPLLVFGSEENSHYPTTFKIVISMMSLTFVLLAVFRFYVLHCNKKRDLVRLVDKLDADRTAFMDLTDMKNENFRYAA